MAVILISEILGHRGYIHPLHFYLNFAFVLHNSLLLLLLNKYSLIQKNKKIRRKSTRARGLRSKISSIQACNGISFLSRCHARSLEPDHLNVVFGLITISLSTTKICYTRSLLFSQTWPQLKISTFL